MGGPRIFTGVELLAPAVVGTGDIAGFDAGDFFDDDGLLMLDGAVGMEDLVGDVAEDGGATGGMRPLVTRTRRRARNLRISSPEENSKSSGRSSALRSEKSLWSCWREAPRAADSSKCRRQRPKWELEAYFRQRLPLGKRWLQRPPVFVRGGAEPGFGVTAGIIDETETTSIDLSVEEFRTIKQQDDRLAAVLPELVTAVVNPSDLGFGMTRMWEILTERPGWSTRAFRAMLEAEARLREEVLRKFKNGTARGLEHTLGGVAPTAEYVLGL